MQSFLRDTRAYKTVNVDDNQNNNSWTIGAIICSCCNYNCLVKLHGNVTAT